FSISTIDGRPISSIVCRSASRICWVLRTRMIFRFGVREPRTRTNNIGMLDSMQMRGAVYVNGTISPADQAVVPVYDHGFVYGEGVYETLRTYNRVPFLY